MDARQHVIKVEVHEVKDVIYKEHETGKEIIPDLFARVEVGSNVQSTVVRRGTSNAVFNASYTFSVNFTKAELQRARIIVSLHHALTLGSRDIGHHAFSVPLIYSKEQHCICKSWVRIFNPNFPTHNAGSLLVSISVCGLGDQPAHFKDNEDQAGQVLGSDLAQSGVRFSKVPEMNLKSYMVYVNVVCGRDFIGNQETGSEPMQPWVRVSHFGMSERTEIMNDCRDPEWQTTLYLPCIMPSYDELVTVEILNGNGSDNLLHFESIDLIHLISNDYAPRWINIYCEKKSTGILNLFKNYITGGAVGVTDYGGRVLISASAEQVQTLYVKGTKPCRSIAVPPTQQRIIAVELYELVSMSDNGPKCVRLVVTHGPFETSGRKYNRNLNGSYSIDDTDGAFPLIESIFSSNDDGDVWDLFVYVYDMTEYTESNVRIAWTRIPYEKAKMSEGNPMWMYVYPLTNRNMPSFKVLISFDVTSNVAGYVRKPRLEYKPAGYVFRSMIYEALHLPCTASMEYPNVFVEVELSGYTWESKVVLNSINPYFFETNEMSIHLPTNLLLAPDITINLYNRLPGAVGNKELICSGQFSLAKVPREWKKAPQWLKLKSTRNPLHRPKILVAFELIPLNEVRSNPNKYNYFDDIVPSTIPSTVSLLFIGIRTFKPLQNPKVAIKFRDYNRFLDQTGGVHRDPKRGDVVDNTGSPVSGRYGNWNYLTSHEFQFDLPKRMQHHSCLEFTITSNNYPGVFGTTILSLNQFLPWLTQEERSTTVELFRMQCMDDCNAVEQAQNEVSGGEKKPEEIKNINVQMLEKIDLVSLNKSKFSDENAFDRRSSSAPPANDGDADADGDADGEKRPEPKESGETTDDELDFEILIDDNVNHAVRDELPYELESEFDCEDLPYMKAQIIKFTPSGIPEVIGTVKFILSITENSKRRSRDRPSKGECASHNITAELLSIRHRMETQKKMFRELYAQAKDLVVRTYVLEAKGLYSSSILPGPAGMFLPNLTGDILTYVWIRNVDHDLQADLGPEYGSSHAAQQRGYPNSIRDANNTKKGLKPVFNACYNIGCSLPENSILKISIVSKGTISEEIIGTTYIDCEDRFFNKNLQQLMLEDAAPIESRTLRTYGDGSTSANELGEVTISHGIIRLWLEMMDLQAAKMKPVQNLGSLDPSNYELRVVVWRAAYYSDDNSTASLMVRGIYQDEAREEAQETDVHYHSKDKTGVFNWRFKYTVSIPTEYTSFKLQLVRYYAISSNETLGETTVDLGFEFHKVRKKNGIHAIPRFSVNVYSLHDSSKVVGSIDVEISILNESDSKRYLVGKGREQPNRDPFLPAVLENRSLLDIDGIADNIKNVGQKLISGVKYTSIGILSVGVLAFVLIILLILR